MSRPAKKVLIVDDSPSILTSAASRLRAAGFEVETSDTAWIAAQVGRFRPDLVLMDVNLGLTFKGTLAVKALKNRSYARGTLFVLYSDLPEDVLSQMASECGADGFICKKKAGELVPAVHRLLDLKPEHATPDLKAG